MLNVYFCTTFEGHYPVGPAAIVVQKDKKLAAEDLNTILKSYGLPGKVVEKDMVLVNTKSPYVEILNDGSY